MPCTSCSSDFNVFNWKIKCGECDDKYCSKCLRKREGIFYCKKCMILMKRPPDRVELMELKPKDLQTYLNKNNISTFGLVEKHELVDLLCNKHIPERPKRGFVEKVTANIATSPQINELIGSIRSSTDPRARPKPAPRTDPPPVPPRCSRPFFSPPSEPFVPPRPPRPPSSPNSTPSTASFVHPSAPPQPSAPPAEDRTTTATPQADNNEPQASTSTSTNDQSDTPSGSPLPARYPKLEDFQSLEELNTLTSKQLKQLLTLNRVDYKGCVEKPELLERATRLWLDNNEQRKDLPEDVQDLCKLCMDGPLDCVLLECGHIATCIDCGKKLAECPICRQYVSRVVRTFKA